MQELEKLKEKINKKDIDLETLKNEIRRNYRLVNNTTKRIEKQIRYLENKINKLFALAKSGNKEAEIAELEERLRKLKRER